MAEESQEDRTEQPTAKRLKDAREKGQIPRSKELSNVAVLGASCVALLALAPAIGAGARQWLRNALAFNPNLIGEPDRLIGHFGTLLLQLMALASPMMLVALVACFISPLAMGGVQLNGKVLQPKFSRMSPVSGFKRIWGKEAMVELLKSVLRVVIVGGVGWLVVSGAFETFLLMLGMDLATAASTGTGVVSRALVMIVAAMGLIAFIDVPWQHLSHRRKLRMTKQEIRDEFKQLEGSPELKARVRQVQHQLANQRMMEAVPTADVVVVNPTHYAVALKYDGTRASAPRVVAKGVDEVALRIREIASAHKVTLVEAPPLARVLYRQAKVGQEIPVKLYEAVAHVLTYVYQLKRWTPRHGAYPQFNPVPVDEQEES
jgi:flagellar biosynthetic protein FlhB